MAEDPLAPGEPRLVQRTLEQLQGRPAALETFHARGSTSEAAVRLDLALQRTHDGASFEGETRIVHPQLVQRLEDTIAQESVRRSRRQDTQQVIDGRLGRYPGHHRRDVAAHSQIDGSVLQVVGQRPLHTLALP